jgi:hypothetical protein
MIIVIANKEKRLINELTILSKVRASLIEDEIAKQICKEYDFETDIIMGIPIDFEEDLEASAKTVDSRIILNRSLLDEDFDIIMRYAIHELVHALQHMRDIGREEMEDEEYLDRGDELEAFQYQIKYEADNIGLEEAEDYAEHLVEFHEIPKKEVEDKKQELMEKVD